MLRKVVVEKQARGLFYDVRDLLRVIRSTYNPVVRTAEMDILRPVMDAELLVLDDLGAEKPSEWVEETMNLIVNTRYNERRPTIFTTNYENLPDEADLDSLKVRVGLPASLPTARDVRVSRVRRRRLPDDAGQRRRRRPGHALEEEQGTPAAAGADARSGARAAARAAKELKWPGGKAGRGAELSWTLCVDDSLGLYLHIPFCGSICSYCNFNRGLLDGALKTRYVAALEREIREAGDGRSADTVFFGGGTPSLLDPPRLPGC